MDPAQLLMYLQVAVGIGLLIFIHELGHYLAARWAGVRVEVFSLGFGARIWGFRRGGTDYRLCVVPLGGYVKVAGEQPLDSIGMGDELCSKPFHKRALFFSGGVVMNLVLALVLFPLVFTWGVPFEAPRISDPLPGSPAWEAGLRGGEKIVRIGGKETYSFDNLRVELALADPRGVDLEVLDSSGKTRIVRVQPRYQPGEGIQTIGISPAWQPEVRLELSDAQGPAAKAGLRTNDKILTFNGQKLDPVGAVLLLTEIEHRPGQERLDLSVERNGEILHVSLKSQARETAAAMGVRPLARQVRGLRTSLEVVQRSGIERGDEIVAVDGKPVFAAADVRRHLPATGTARLSVLRGRGTVPLVLTLELRDAAERDQWLDGVAILDAEHPEPVVRVSPDSSAAQAGLLDGDRITRLDDREIKTWEDIYEFMSDYRRRERSNAVKVAVLRTGPTSQPALLEVLPRRDRVQDFGLVLLTAPEIEVFQAKSLGAALTTGFVCSLDLIKQLVVTLKKITTGDVSPKNLGGIITISRASYQFAKGGWAKFLFFLALLSINLAFINVLPIPILDGGHLMFLLIEKVKGSPVSERTLTYAQLVGMVFIVTLMVYVTYNDLQRTELFTFFRNLFRG